MAKDSDARILRRETWSSAYYDEKVRNCVPHILEPRFVNSLMLKSIVAGGLFPFPPLAEVSGRKDELQTALRGEQGGTAIAEVSVVWTGPTEFAEGVV